MTAAAEAAGSWQSLRRAAPVWQTQPQAGVQQKNTSILEKGQVWAL
jgi:hypothetical protein